MAQDIITNGGFIGAATGWDLGDYAIYGNNNMLIEQGTEIFPASTLVSQVIPSVVVGKSYEFYMDIVGNTVEGFFYVGLGGQDSKQQFPATTGTVHKTIVCQNDDMNTFFIQGFGIFDVETTFTNIRLYGQRFSPLRPFFQL